MLNKKLAPKKRKVPSVRHRLQHLPPTRPRRRRNKQSLTQLRRLLIMLKRKPKLQRKEKPI